MTNSRLNILINSSKMNKNREVEKKLNKVKNIKFKIQKYNKEIYDEKGIPEAINSIIDLKYTGKLTLDSSEKDIKENIKRLFFKKTKYVDDTYHLGSGSYGVVFSVSDNNNNSLAVKMVEIYDEVSFLDEIRLSLLFSNEKIGPKILGLYKIDVVNKYSIGYGFIIMEKMKYTLDNYLQMGFVNEDILIDLFKKSLNLGFACFDYKASNIMLNNTNYIRLIDFGEFCCDTDRDTDVEAILDVQIINMAFTTDHFYHIDIFNDIIKNILYDKERFNRIINLFSKSTRACNISDKFGQRHETLTSKMIRTFNHYITSRLIKKYQLYKGYKFFKDNKSKYLDYSFADENVNTIKTSDKKIWIVRLIVCLNSIIKKNINSYEELLPKKYVIEYLDKSYQPKRVKRAKRAKRGKRAKRTRKNRIKKRRTRKNRTRKTRRQNKKK